MHYYIDGYNLLFRASPSDREFSKLRQHLIDELNQKIELLGLDITIVFDAQYHPSEGTRSHYKRLEIIFTELNETADNRILDELKTESKPHLQTVVTSDKKLAWFARRCSAKTESIEHFVEWLNKRYKNRLRQAKEAGQNLQNLKTKKTIIAQKKLPLKQNPPADKPPEECSDYYLDLFQKRLEKLEKAEPKKEVVTKRKAQQKKENKKPPKHTDTPLSDHARWLKIFEERL